ncbi:hypothetical protein C7C46_00855 [Streptomyces tateyamensis]|uniref:Uncharacterized protein n=2 Tax=Streptomyces tateyamensis TaxID=565073 RepID=A0A2V4NW95_9ACTN|nr:hypothetical protein C7C46_00855 [Streptomyces tateyamensis]
MRALAGWTRQRVGEGASAGQLGPVLTELGTRGRYGRSLAVVGAAIAGDVAFLEARLADPDGGVRAQALKASLRLPVSDAALERAMDDAPYAVRRQIADAVVAGGRTALAERLLESVRESWGDQEAARLLPGCGPEAVARLLPGLFLAVARWQAIGSRHPDLLLDEIARQLAELPEQSRPAWWQRNADALAATAEARPLRVLELLEQHCPPQLPGPVRAGLGKLLRAAPGRTIRLLTAPQRRAAALQVPLSRTALGRVARLGAPELLDLGRAWSHRPDSLALLLRALPPSRRNDFFDAATAGQDLGRSEFSEALLTALPRPRAQAEARRIAAQAAERGAPWAVVLTATAHLPVAEARPELLAATRRPAAEDRAVAYPLLVRNAARSGQPAAVAELLQDLQRLRNEQDPVRSPALAALAEVPPRLFTGAVAEALGRLATDAVEARDSSWRTRLSLSELAVAVLREHAVSGEQALIGWALATLTELSGQLGGAGLGRLDRTLRRGQEVAVFQALLPWLEAGADKVDHTLTFALARALGRRARGLSGLQELLWQAVQFGNDATVRQAVELWLEDPRTRSERAVRVLELEPSAAVLPAVLGVLTHRRTDLLHLVLGERPPYGRFLTPGSHWLPPIHGIDRWTPSQQASAARLLTAAVGDAALPKHNRAWHLRTAAAVPEVGFDLVGRYLESLDTVLAEAALGALVWTDRPADALPLLLAHAGDDRARVALFAAGRAARFVAPSRLAQVLRAALLPAAGGTPAPGAKITSRKELVRLAATLLPVAEAAALLVEVYELPDQHRDVQAACVPVAAGLLRSPLAWRLLELAAAGLPVTQGAVLRTAPYELPVGDRPRYARLVGQVVGSAERETADRAIALLARWAPWYPEAMELLRATAVDLGNRSSWPAVADGLVTLTSTPEGSGPLLAVLAALVAAEDAVPVELDAAPGRDRPARQRIGHLVARLATAATTRISAGQSAAARQAGELLCAAGDFLPQGVQLRAAALDLEAPAAELPAALDDLAQLHTGRPALAARTAQTVRARLGAAGHPGDPVVLLLATERLAASGTYSAGLLAVALTQALGARTKWLPEWRSQLRALRGHAEPDVREAALGVVTAGE